MPKQLEIRRLAKVEFRVKPDGVEGRILADVVRYNTPDDYRTTFRAGVFAKSLADHMPTMVWNHDWDKPIGRWIDADDTRDRLRMLGELDLDMVRTPSGRETDTPAVPIAHAAWVQMNKRTVSQFSVGFMRQNDQPHPEFRGITEITEGWLDEASPVIVGAVPGTALLGTRSAVRAPMVERNRRSIFLFEKRTPSK